MRNKTEASNSHASSFISKLRNFGTGNNQTPFRVFFSDDSTTLQLDPSDDNNKHCHIDNKAHSDTAVHYNNEYIYLMDPKNKKPGICQTLWDINLQKIECKVSQPTSCFIRTEKHLIQSAQFY